MRIKFPQEITLRCVEILVGEYDGQECELDMNCNVIFGAGHEYDGVQIDEETPTKARLWLRVVSWLLTCRDRHSRSSKREGRLVCGIGDCSNNVSELSRSQFRSIPLTAV